MYSCSLQTMKAKQKQNDETLQGEGLGDEYMDDSSTSINEPQADTDAEIQAPPVKKRKIKPSQEMPLYVQQAMRQLSEKDDEEQVFGDFCASELRQIKNPANKRIFKQIVMEAITNIGEAEALGVVYKRFRPLHFHYPQPAARSTPSPYGSDGSSSSYPPQYQVPYSHTQQIDQQEEPGHESSLLTTLF